MAASELAGGWRFWLPPRRLVQTFPAPFHWSRAHPAGDWKGQRRRSARLDGGCQSTRKQYCTFRLGWVAVGKPFKQLKPISPIEPRALCQRHTGDTSNPFHQIDCPVPFTSRSRNLACTANSWADQDQTERFRSSSPWLREVSGLKRQLSPHGPQSPGSFSLSSN